MYRATGEMALLMSCAMPLAIHRRAQALLLSHDRLLGLAQIVVSLLQRSNT